MGEGLYRAARTRQKARDMAIHRRPPHPARGPIMLLVLLLVLIGAVVLIAQSAEEVPTRPMEVDVARDQPS